MYQRSDGIVEFDPSICIGCKSCMQACPYDSIYLDPETNAAAKCHFCAHRLDVGLEPACVVVCPEHAILAGDLNDPASEISHVLANAPATVRKPEQGTGPKLFYINGNDWSLHPTAAPAQASFMWADKISEQNTNLYERGSIRLPVIPGRTAKSGTPIRTPGEQGRPLDGPIQIGGRMAEHMVQVAYNAQHRIHWHWELPSYLVTKNIAGGMFMLLSLGSIFGLFEAATFLAGGITSMLFMLLTVILLVKDLAQPKRFLNVLLRPQWKSWLARGAYIMVAFTAVAGLWWLLEGAAYLDYLPAGLAEGIRPLLAWLTLPLALGVVIYSAFLLGQAEGRDMWQSNLLPFQLFAQSILAGSGVFVILSALTPMPAALREIMISIFPASIAVNLLLTLAGKFNTFASEVALLAHREMTRGRFRNHFWWGGIALGHVIPLALVLSFSAFALPLAVLCAVIGLFFYEYAFVMAPQYVPNS
jgi:formate-dependent nitrite reductase membrane component NrfD/ferredoxin